MKYKYLALDIDGCVSDGKGKIIDANYLHQLRKALTNFSATPFLCTGRSAPYVEAMSQVLGITNWAICENGAYLYNPVTDEVRYHPLLNQVAFKALDDINKVLRSKEFKQICKPEIGKDVCISLNPINMDIEELYLYIKDLIDTDSLYINFSTTAVDITPKGVDKGSSLLFLAKVLDFKLEEIVAIGDSSGDLPFMELAGYSACPKNSLNIVKDISKYTSDFDSTKGVVDIINHISDQWLT